MPLATYFASPSSSTLLITFCRGKSFFFIARFLSTHRSWHRFSLATHFFPYFLSAFFFPFLSILLSFLLLLPTFLRFFPQPVTYAIVLILLLLLPLLSLRYSPSLITPCMRYRNQPMPTMSFGYARLPFSCILSSCVMFQRKWPFGRRALAVFSLVSLSFSLAFFFLS